MRHALLVTPEGAHLVRADGSRPDPRDAEMPTLHVLPELFMARAVFERGFSPALLCTATVIEPAGGIVLPDTLVVRQPVPNRRIYIAGSDDSRYGVLVPLPEPVPETVTLRFAWRFSDAAQEDEVLAAVPDLARGVDHVVRLRLRASGNGHVFTMDTSAWPPGPGDTPPPCDRAARAVLDPLDLSEDRFRRIAAEWVDGGDILGMSEQLEIPSVRLNEIWGLEEFAAPQLHELRRTAAFDPAAPDSIAHRANACTEMPASVLAEAVRLARSVPHGDGTPYASGAGSIGACERHPALLALTLWWNANAPDPRHRRAGFCAVEVRAADDGLYRNIDGDVPEVAIAGEEPALGARVGDVVLVQFLQSVSASTFGPGGLQHWDVAGRPWMTVGVSAEDVRDGAADEAWRVLQGLETFPERFPEAWAWLTAEAARPATPTSEAELRRRPWRGLRWLRRSR